MSEQTEVTIHTTIECSTDEDLQKALSGLDPELRNSIENVLKSEKRTPIEQEPDDALCLGFQVYLGEKNNGGILLNGVEKIHSDVEQVHFFNADGGRSFERPILKLVFKSMVSAKDVINAYGRICTIEIRAAVQYYNALEKRWEVTGTIYDLEVTPVKIETEPLTAGGTARAELWFEAHSCTATDEEGRKLWSLEWK